ncbi:MAG: hypothetical protein NZ518_02560 [Dehalococcoidia bacterium]|nr:hypothetical protein [Dehalococcoidia bacterium]
MVSLPGVCSAPAPTGLAVTICAVTGSTKGGGGPIGRAAANGSLTVRAARVR